MHKTDIFDPKNNVILFLTTYLPYFVLDRYRKQTISFFKPYDEFNCPFTHQNHADSQDFDPNILQIYTLHVGLEKKLFVSCNSPKRNKVGRSVNFFFLDYVFGQKWVFYVRFTLIRSWEGGKNFRVGILLNKNILG